MAISKISFGAGYDLYAEHEKRMAEFAAKRSRELNSLNYKGDYEDFKKELENKVFTFKDKEGKFFKGTIKEYFENSIKSTREIYNKAMYHATTDRDVAISMIQNGLDWTRTRRMRCGPGTYFAPCAEEARMQVGAGTVIEGVYCGNKDSYPIMKSGFYDAIVENEELRKFAKQYDSGGKINKYCHDLLQNEMGIDFYYSSPGHGGAYVVLNDDCLNLSTYYW